jgi:hypothetical protein
MKRLEVLVAASQVMFRERLERLERHEGGLTKDRYVRFLSMQYHLTNGVQRPIMTAAAHADFAHRRSLRKFLVEFANEEELHYEIARRDLENLGVEPTPCPLDVKLWRAYFESIIVQRPFIRLGATCILENLAGTSGPVITRLFAAAPFLTPRNTRFFAIHRHDETLPHGDQIMEALAAAKLEDRHVEDLTEGAETGLTIYMRLVEWSLQEGAAAVRAA